MEVTQLRLLKNKHKEYILSKFDGTVAVGVSEKVSKNTPLGTFAVTVYVEKKKPIAQIAADQRIDEDTVLLADIGSENIDVKELGKIHALAWTDKFRPVKVGVSEGHYKITAGTGSVLVHQGNPDVLYRLSNNHVYANQNDATAGDPIYQPGPYDYGGQEDTVGQLFSFVALKFDGSANYVDAALRTIGPEESAKTMELNAAPVGLALAEVDQEVVKTGRTTEVTWGKIGDVDLSVIVGYGQNSEALFDDQILVESTTIFSQGGDSGSPVFVVLNERLYWVGLLFAGNERGTTTICNHASMVEGLLNCFLYIDPDSGDPVSPPGTDDGEGCLGWLLKLPLMIWNFIKGLFT
jgi:hypothetical protein